MVDVIGDVEQVVALLRGPLEAFRRQQAGDPDRRVRLLVDRRQDRQPRHRRPELALELQRRAGPGLLDEFDAFLDPLAAFLHVDAEGVEFVADEAAPDAEIEPALRQLVQGGGLLGHPHRIVERQHRGAGAEPDALGARRQIGQERVVGREQATVADEVMLDDPGVVDADAVGEFDLLDDAAVVGLRVAHRRQVGRQIEQSEFHRGPPGSDISAAGLEIDPPSTRKGAAETVCHTALLLEELDALKDLLRFRIGRCLPAADYSWFTAIATYYCPRAGGM